MQRRNCSLSIAYHRPTLVCSISVSLFLFTTSDIGPRTEHRNLQGSELTTAILRVHEGALCFQTALVQAAKREADGQ